MDVLAGLKLVVGLLFGTIFGIPSFIVGLAISVVGSLWLRNGWRGLYWAFVIVGSLPFATIAVLPIMAASPIMGTATGGNISDVHVWMLISFITCPFSLGLLVGAILAPLYR